MGASARWTGTGQYTSGNLLQYVHSMYLQGQRGGGHAGISFQVQGMLRTVLRCAVTEYTAHISRVLAYLLWSTTRSCGKKRREEEEYVYSGVSPGRCRLRMDLVFAQCTQNPLSSRAPRKGWEGMLFSLCISADRSVGRYIKAGRRSSTVMLSDYYILRGMGSMHDVTFLSIVYHNLVVVRAIMFPTKTHHVT